jgi:ketosteroid isomerase-like protein
MLQAIRVTALILFLSALSLGVSGGRRMALASPATKTWAGEAQIRALLETQTAAWNRGDVDAFMTGYWKSEQTEFVGANGITRGWQAVHDRYIRNYPDAKAMGRLSFSKLEVHLVCGDAAYAIGQFQLEREHDRPAGIFTLNFRKFQEGWRIVADHTSAFPEAAAAGFH